MSDHTGYVGTDHVGNTGHEGTLIFSNLSGILGNVTIYGFGSDEYTSADHSKANKIAWSTEKHNNVNKYSEVQYWENNTQLGQYKSDVWGQSQYWFDHDWYAVLDSSHHDGYDFYTNCNSNILKENIVDGTSSSMSLVQKTNRLSKPYSGEDTATPADGISYDTLTNCSLALYSTARYLANESVIWRFINHFIFAIPRYTLTYSPGSGFSLNSVFSAIDNGNYYNFKTIIPTDSVYTSGRACDYIVPAISVNKTIMAFGTPSISTVSIDTSGTKYASISVPSSETNAEKYTFYLDSTSSPIGTTSSKSISLTNEQYYGAHTIYCKINTNESPTFIHSVEYKKDSTEDIGFAEEFWVEYTESSISAAYPYHKYVKAPTNLSVKRTGIDSCSVSWDAVTDAAYYAYELDSGDWVVSATNSATISGISYGNHIIHIKAYCAYSSEYGPEATIGGSPLLPKLNRPSHVLWSNNDSGGNDTAPNAGTLSFSFPEYGTQYIIYVDGVEYYDSGS